MSGTEPGFSGRAAIAGIGATEFSKESGRSELQLAVEATQAALEDAGLSPSDVDGMVTFTMDTNPEIELARMLGGQEDSATAAAHAEELLDLAAARLAAGRSTSGAGSR